MLFDQITEAFGNANSPAATKIGIAGFTFYAQTRETVNYASDTPTAVLEDGTSTEDTIILKPVTLTIEGDVGNVYAIKSPALSLLSPISSTVGRISSFLPDRTQAQIQSAISIAATARDAANAIDNLINTGAQIADVFGLTNQNGTSITEQFTSLIETLHFSRALVDIEANGQVYTDMRVTAELSRDNQRDVIQFKISATEVRKSSVIYSAIPPILSNPSEAINGQAQTVVNQGVQSGDEADSSLLSQILGFGG